MKYLLVVSAFLLFSAQSCNTGYDIYKKAENVTFGYKWADAKNESGEKVPAILLMVQNDNALAIHYTLTVDFYYEGILRESGHLQYCVPANRTRKGKLNGVYLISEKMTADQITSRDFKVELNDITVEQITECSQE